MKRFFWLSNMILALSLLVGGCAVPVSPASTPTKEDVIKIGFAGNLSHPGVVSIMNAANMAINDANNAGGATFDKTHYMFELVPVDDSGDPQRAVAAAQKLVNEGVVGVVGHVGSTTSIFASKIYGEVGVVQVSPFATDPVYTLKGPDTSYRVCPNKASEPLMTARMTFDLGAEKIIIVYAEDEVALDLATRFAGAFKEVGGEVTGVFDSRSPDILSQIRAKDPDIVVFTGSPEPVGLLVRKLRGDGLEMPVVGFDRLVSKIYLEVAGPTAESSYAWFPGESTALMAGFKSFAEDYRAAEFPQQPDYIDPFAPYGYDAASIIIEAIGLGGSVKRGDVAGAMRKIRAFPGVTGEITFNKNGDTIEQPYRLYKVINGQWVDWIEHEWIILEEREARSTVRRVTSMSALFAPDVSSDSDPDSTARIVEPPDFRKAKDKVYNALSWDNYLRGKARKAAEYIISSITQGKNPGEAEVTFEIPRGFSRIWAFYRVTYGVDYPHVTTFYSNQALQTLRERDRDKWRRQIQRQELDGEPYEYSAPHYQRAAKSYTQRNTRVNTGLTWRAFTVAFHRENITGQELLTGKEWDSHYRHFFEMKVRIVHVRRFERTRLFYVREVGSSPTNTNWISLGRIMVDDDDNSPNDIAFP